MLYILILLITFSYNIKFACIVLFCIFVLAKLYYQRCAKNDQAIFNFSSNLNKYSFNWFWWCDCLLCDCELSDKTVCEVIYLLVHSTEVKLCSINWHKYSLKPHLASWPGLVGNWHCRYGYVLFLITSACVTGKDLWAQLLTLLLYMAAKENWDHWSIL